MSKDRHKIGNYVKGKQYVTYRKTKEAFCYFRCPSILKDSLVDLNLMLYILSKRF